MAELTEDDEEQKLMTKQERDVYDIKSKIKKNLIKNNRLPDSLMSWYKYGRILGKGAFGIINLCLHKLSMKLCAVKSINMCNMNSKEAIYRISVEKEVLKACRHPNIVKLYECIHDADTGYELLFMELCIGGDLLSYLRKRRRLKESQAKVFLK